MAVTPALSSAVRQLSLKLEPNFTDGTMLLTGEYYYVKGFGKERFWANSTASLADNPDAWISDLNGEANSVYDFLVAP